MTGVARRAGLAECLEAAIRAQSERHGGSLWRGHLAVGAVLTGIWYWVHGLPGDVDPKAESGSPHTQNVAAILSTARLIVAVIGAMALLYVGYLLFA